MSTFEVKAYNIKIEPHPNADAIELAKIGEYRSIIRKGQYKDGDLVIYIPEAAVLPEWVLKKLDFWDNDNNKGKLNGPKGNRVKAIRLRGIVSQGLIFPLEFRKDVVDVDTNISSDVWVLIKGEAESGIVINKDTDYAKIMGIEKYEPPIPIHMAGEVFNAFGMTIKYDIENYKKWPDILLEGEDVVMTEKLHGTWMCAGYHPNSTVPIVTSKGLSDKGLAFKFNEANKNNLYINALKNTTDEKGNNIIARYKYLRNDSEPFYILGEIFGAGIQDLTYGNNPPSFRVFDIYVGEPGKGKYLNWDELVQVCHLLQVQTVPLLYRGPFSVNKMQEVTDGKETVTGKETCIREGVVIKPIPERNNDSIGRVILKNVSDKYLTRKNPTEYT